MPASVLAVPLRPAIAAYQNLKTLRCPATR
jgi:hypothetical protein